VTDTLPLRPLHPPPPLAGAGPTIFEIALTLVFAVALTLLALRILRGLRRRHWRGELLSALRLVESQVESAPHEATTGAMQLVRRILLRHHAREQVASLTGDGWLSLLDGFCQTDWFTAGAGRELASAVHARPAEAEVATLALEAAQRTVLASLERLPDPPHA
jgi:hypothetical protein